MVPTSTEIIKVKWGCQHGTHQCVQSRHLFQCLLPLRKNVLRFFFQPSVIVSRAEFLPWYVLSVCYNVLVVFFAVKEACMISYLCLNIYFPMWLYICYDHEFRNEFIFCLCWLLALEFLGETNKLCLFF